METQVFSLDVRTQLDSRYPVKNGPHVVDTMAVGSMVVTTKYCN